VARARVYHGRCARHGQGKRTSPGKDDEVAENGGVEVLRQWQRCSGDRRRSAQGSATPEMKGEGEAHIICQGRARWGGAHRKDGVAVWVDEWCYGGTREGWSRSGGADSQGRKKCTLGHSVAAMPKQRGKKGGSGGPGSSTWKRREGGGFRLACAGGSGGPVAGSTQARWRRARSGDMAQHEIGEEGARR
jgi:hypothetical protein